MALNHRAKRLMAEHKLYQEAGPNDNYRMVIDLEAFDRCYFLIHGLDGLYKGGEYIGILQFKDDFPFSAPYLWMLTPSGRFQCDTLVCTSFSHYHNESWAPSQKLHSIIMSIVSMFFDSNIIGIAHKIESDTKIKDFAVKSTKFNADLVQSYPLIEELLL